MVGNVYPFGSPTVTNKDEYLKAWSVVCGKFVKGYASNDWILEYLLSVTGGGIINEAGLVPLESTSEI